MDKIDGMSFPKKVAMSEKFANKSDKIIQEMEEKAYNLLNKKPAHQQDDKEEEKGSAEDAKQQVDAIREDIAALRSLEQQHQ